MKCLPFICLIIFSLYTRAQKRVVKSLLDPSISFVKIDANASFQVRLRTIKSNEIRVEATMEGEYSNDLELTLKEQRNTLLVSAGFQPNFKNPNDKLSAHKVVSIALDISIPEGKNVTVFGTSARVIAEGNYKELNVTLSDGTCELNEIEESATIKTQSGAIIIYGKAADIKAESKYGRVSANPIPKGANQYQLNTVTGNISLNKTE